VSQQAVSPVTGCHSKLCRKKHNQTILYRVAERIKFEDQHTSCRVYWLELKRFISHYLQHLYYCHRLKYSDNT